MKSRAIEFRPAVGRMHPFFTSSPSGVERHSRALSGVGASTYCERCAVRVLSGFCECRCHLAMRVLALPLLISRSKSGISLEKA